jgi:hypothetical protein
MKIQKCNCTACGAPIELPEDIYSIVCPFCKVNLFIKRDDNKLIISAIEKVNIGIESSGKEIQSVLKGESELNQSELKRLQLNQDLSLLQLQLSNVQTEIRTINREKKTKLIINQIEDLQISESRIIERIQIIQNGLSPLEPGLKKLDLRKEKVDLPEKRRISGWTIIVFGSSTLICGILFLLLFLVAQIGNKAGYLDNLVGFVEIIILCPLPLLIFGGLMIGIGGILIKRKKEVEV